MPDLDFYFRFLSLPPMKQILAIGLLLFIGFGQVGIEYLHHHSEEVRHEHKTIHVSKAFCSVCVCHLQLGSYQAVESFFIYSLLFVEVQNSFPALSLFLASPLQLRGRAPPVE